MRNADPAYLTLLLQVAHRLPCFLKLGPIARRRPMHLIEINHVSLQAAQTVLALLTNRRGRMVLTRFAIRVPAKTALCEHVRPFAFPLFQRLRNDFLGVAGAIDSGSVDPVDAQFEGAHDGRDGIRVLLITPGEFPAAASDGPCAKSHSR